MHINFEHISLIEDTATRCHDLLLLGKAAEAISIVKELIAVDPDDLNICIFASGRFIDIASDVDDIPLADRGIEMIEKALAECLDVSEETVLQFRYNLSNAYAVKHKLCLEKDQPDEAGRNLQQQKWLLQAVLLRRDHIPAELRPAVLTNYANALDHLGRTFEAIDHYMDCLYLEPEHSMARGNCAWAIERVLSFSEQHRLSNLHTCWEFSTAAVADREGTLKWGGPEAIRGLEGHHSRLCALIDRNFEGGIVALEEFVRHRYVDHSADTGPEWIKSLLHDRLLLSFNQIPIWSKYETLEDAFFDRLSFGMDKKSEGGSIDRINLFNAIKEEFVTARYIYYQAMDRDEELVLRNDMTLFGDPEGDAEFGLISGLLKTSLRCSVDLLDKIAVFLGLYLELDVPIIKLNFSNVWFEGQNVKNGVLHSKIEAAMRGNGPLKGLRDLQRDLSRQEYPGPVKSARNAAVHRWVTLRWRPIEERRDGTSWNLDDFAGLAFFMLRQAKAAILSLAAAVNIEERRRREEKGETAKKILFQTPLFMRKPVSARTTEDWENPDLEIDLDGLADPDP